MYSQQHPLCLASRIKGDDVQEEIDTQIKLSHPFLLLVVNLFDQRKILTEDDVRRSRQL